MMKAMFAVSHFTASHRAASPRDPAVSHVSVHALLLSAAVLAVLAPFSAQASEETAASEGTAAAGPAAEAPAQAPTLPYLKRYAPENNMWELGMFAGVLFPSASHELREPGTAFVEQPYKTAANIGVRLGYLPASFLGLEAEAAAMPSGAEDGTSAGLWGARVHLLGQLPGASIVPFGVLGMGVLGAASDSMGSDADPAFHFGVGVKAALDEHLLLRLDLRDNLTQKVDVAQGKLTHHPELTFGLSFVPERRKPDTDADGFADHRDACPMEAGEVEGCPAPPPAPEPAPCDAPATASPSAAEPAPPPLAPPPAEPTPAEPTPEEAAPEEPAPAPVTGDPAAETPAAETPTPEPKAAEGVPAEPAAP